MFMPILISLHSHKGLAAPVVPLFLIYQVNSGEAKNVRLSNECFGK